MKVKHKVATTYHSQTSGQIELSNEEIKKILEKGLNPSRRDWSLHLHDDHWACKTSQNSLHFGSPLFFSFGEMKSK